MLYFYNKFYYYKKNWRIDMGKHIAVSTTEICHGLIFLKIPPSTGKTVHDNSV